MNCRKDEFVDLIVSRIKPEVEDLRNQFRPANASIATRFVAVDNLLPEAIVMELYEAFPKNSSSWREMKSLREWKYTTKQLDNVPSILKDIFLAIQAPEVIKLVEEITGIKNQIPDPGLYAGGLSMMDKNHFLNPHIDNSHNMDRNLYRRVNFLYYISPEWQEENGGNLELWDKKVNEKVTICSNFNRLVFMETNQFSWHSVNRVRVNKARCCISSYYFTHESPSGSKYFHITAFNGRPEEKTKRLVCQADNFFRSFVRKIFSKGLGRIDVYKPNE